MRSCSPGVLTAKDDRDMTSEADFLVEREVRALLRQRTPAIGFWGEEEGVTGDNDNLFWAFDPIDGTVNFIRNIPLCGTSLGLIEQGRPKLGVIDLPFLDARYSALEGEGAYLGSRRISVSRTTDLHDAVVGIGDYAVGQDAEKKNRLRVAVTHQLAKNVQRVRMNGSAAVDLAWLSDGKLDASITLANHPWDIAAGVAIAREAGAVVMDRDGTDHNLYSRATIVTTPDLTDALLALLCEAENSAVAKTGHGSEAD